MSEFFKRNYNFEIRAENNPHNKTKIIRGRPIVYESKTDLGFCDEIIKRGALDKADLSNVCFFVNHDTSKIPLARFDKENKGSTMQITLDNDGMGIDVELDTENNTDARALYSAVERGDITGMSFMFTINDEEWENLESDHPTRTITSIGKVIEVSAVTFPAYESTEISARDKTALENAKKSVNNARSNDLELEKLKAKYLYNI